MKLRIIFSFLLLSSWLSMLGQEYQYVPFPTENAVWKSDEFSGFCDNPIHYCGSHTYCTGDVITINDTAYIGIYSGYTSGSFGPVAAMRVQEDPVNHKVFLRSVNNPHNEVLLYDFDLVVGDTLPFVNWDVYESNGDQIEAIIGKTLVVSIIDTVDLDADGILRRQFRLDEHSFGQSWPINMTIIEGIGATAGLGVGIDFSEFEHSYQLQCLRHNEEFVYGYALSNETLQYYDQFGYQYCAPPVGISEPELADVRFYPNPVVGNHLKCNEAEKIKNVRMLNLLGSVVPVSWTTDGLTLPDDLSSGVYLLQVVFHNSETSYQRIVKP